MGVPTLGCDCRVCTSSDPRDRRLRPSIAVEWQDADTGREHRVVIDTGPDFREQALRFHIRHIDAVLYTHAHADHILGLDDLRPLTFAWGGAKMPLYADAATADVLERVFGYTFSPTATYPTRARVELKRIAGPVEIASVPFMPVPILHGRLTVTGYRFGNAAYLSDMNAIPETSYPLLAGVQVVVLDALRPQPHPTHANVEQATALAARIGAPDTWFTHIAHEILHAEVDPTLGSSAGPSIRLAYDGLRIPIEL